MAKLNAARDALKEESRSLALKRASQEARLAKLQAVACIRNDFFSNPDPISNVILYLDPFLPLVIPDPDPISKVIQ
jgi:hypothetical protein